MRALIASVATLALISGGACAQPGKDNDRGNGAAKAQAGPKSDRGADPKADRGGGLRTDKRAGTMADKRGGPPTMRDRGPSRDAPAARTERTKSKPANRGNAGASVTGSRNDKVNRGNNGKGRGTDRGGREIDVRFLNRADSFARLRDYDRRVVAYDGCPPGLAKKYNGCMPPGLARQQPAYRPSFFGYDGFGSTRFYYDDGFLLRLGGDGRISSSIPLLGGALSIGNLWPDYYRPLELRPYYTSYYGLQPDAYGYANNVVYRLDPQTAAITSIAALFTGDDFVVGQAAPVGYDVYNVPYRHRDRFRDGPEASYRYSDGYVYRLDPETRLVAAAIELALD